MSSSSALPLIGFHCGTGKLSGGRSFPEHLEALRSVLPVFTAAQFFASSPKSFHFCSWTTATTARVRATAERLGVRLFIHAPYLINPCAWTGGGTANPDGERIAGLVVNLLQRGAEMGVEGVVIHVGKSLKLGETEGMRRMTAFVAAVIERGREAGKPLARLLIETCAGQGTELCRDLRVFGAFVRDLIERYGREHIGVCVDTCHVFASGYPMPDLLRSIEADIGWGDVRLIHLNDSETPCGSRKDRHACIGEGKIGSVALGEFCTAAAACNPDLAFVFETPETTDGSSRHSEHAWFASLF